MRVWDPLSSAVRATVSSDHSMETEEEVIPRPPVVSDPVTPVPVSSTTVTNAPIRPASEAVSPVTVPCSAVSTVAAVIMQIHNDTLVPFDFPKFHATGKDWNSGAKAYLKKESQTIENPAYDILTAYDIITADFLE